MRFENAFVVQAPVQDVWEALMDVERVAPCMPGAEVLERTGDEAFNVSIRVKLGPMSLQYKGQVAIVDRDDTTWHATLRARAREARGQGTADARIEMALAERGEGTQATIITELQISGRAAAMGRGMIGDVAQKLTDLFAVNLAEMLERPEPAVATEAPPPAAEPPPPRVAPVAAVAEPSLPVVQLAASVIAGRLSNPRTLLIAAGGLAALFGTIGYALGRRR